MNNENVYRFAGLLLLGTAMAISFSFRWRADRSGDKISAVREEGFFLAALRSLAGLALWFGALFYLINPNWMTWSQVELPAWARWLGAGIMLVCLPLVYWLFSSLGKNVTRTVAIRKEHALVKSGPYHWVRHPLYSVGLVMFLGFSLLAANWFIALAILVAFPILARRTPLEEARLIERFGDEYREYMRETGRYFPRIRKGTAG
jgi:protein-S-isoprenylcysteine O-methyltransferase Ste14